MSDDLERVLQGLREAQEFAKSYRFQMTDDYLALLAQVEAMPQNQSGSDKTGIWRGLRGYVETFRHVRRAPRKP